VHRKISWSTDNDDLIIERNILQITLGLLHHTRMYITLTAPTNWKVKLKDVTEVTHIPGISTVSFLVN
jgi:hypothetical protein